MSKALLTKRRVIIAFAAIVILLAGTFVLSRFLPGSPNGDTGATVINAVAGTTQMVRLHMPFMAKISNATFDVSGQITDVAAVPLDPNTLFDPSIYTTLPVTITVPSDKRDGTYVGKVEIRDSGKTVATQQVTVVVQKTSASFIPRGVAHPISDRIATPHDSQIPMVKDELLVEVGLNFSKDGAAQKIKDIAAQTHGAIIGSLSDDKTFQLRYDGINIDDLAKKKDDIGWIIGVQAVDYNVFADAALNPNDMGEAAWLDASQDKRTWGQRFIGLPKAWDKTTGDKSVRVGIIDDSFYGMHDDLRANTHRVTGVSLDGLIGYFNRYSPGRDPHGTKVAGTACAEGDNGIGVAGVMWECGLALYDAGGYLPVSNSYDAASVRQMMKEAANNSMRVVNMSFGVGSNPKLCDHKPFGAFAQAEIASYNDQIKEEVQSIRDKKQDVLWVMAAGNSCRDVAEVAPAPLAQKFDNVITVAAIDQPKSAEQTTKPKIAWYSNYGASDIVAAPGTDIYSTSVDYKQKPNPSTYANGSGTSLAAPFVTGLAGLVWSAHDSFTAKQVKQCIIDSANNAGQIIDQHEANKYTTHVINAPETLNCTPDPDPDSPLGSSQQCVFSMATLPEQCESTNPTVKVKFTNVAGSSACLFTSHLQWVAGDSKTEQTDQLISIPVNSSVSLGTHTFDGAGKHLISHTVTSVSSGPCVILDSLYEFTLLPNKK